MKELICIEGPKGCHLKIDDELNVTGNTLIAQGIETSKWVPSEIKGKKLYEATKKWDNINWRI